MGLEPKNIYYRKIKFINQYYSADYDYFLFKVGLGICCLKVNTLRRLEKFVKNNKNTHNNAKVIQSNQINSCNL